MRKKEANVDIRKFIIVAGSLLFAWLVCYEGYLKHLGQPDAFLTFITAKAGQTVLSAMNYPTSAAAFEDGILLQYQEVPLLKIANNCNGLAVLMLFAGLVAAFPGPGKMKAWYIPLGLLFLFFCNALRVAALSIIQIHYPDWLQFNHKYTFTVIIYGLVFLLWMLWLNRFAKPPISKIVPA